MFGVESLIYDGPLFLLEGAFDSTPLTKRRCAALATLSNAPSKIIRSFLWNIGKRPIIVVRDADSAGKKLEPFGDIVVTVPDEYGDLGNAPELE